MSYIQLIDSLTLNFPVQQTFLFHNGFNLLCFKLILILNN